MQPGVRGGRVVFAMGQAQQEPPGPLKPRARQGGALGTDESVPSSGIQDPSSSPLL